MLSASFTKCLELWPLFINLKTEMLVEDFSLIPSEKLMHHDDIKYFSSA